MEPMEVAHAYFAAWNARNPDAIVAAFAAGGTYTDPLAGTLTGPAIGAYAGRLFAAFPDLSFELVSAAPAGAGVVATQWLMKGTNTAPFQGLPPTGRSIALPGADFVTVAGDKVQSVVGYFDSAATPRQLGLQAIVQPVQLGPFAFGTSVLVQSGKTTKPGAFSLTVLEARSDDEVQRVRDYSRRIAGEMLRMPGFISWLGAIVGRRMYTVTAWEQAEAAGQLLKDGTHKEAMGEFFGSGVASGGTTSVWSPHHQGPMWQRCSACDSMEIAEQGERRCRRCGAALPEPRCYW
jgi:steroid delta-isomerase-like uncharacterized protein